MTAVRDLIERNLGTDELTAVLLMDMREIQTPGYEPIPLRNWEIDDGYATAVVTFGPYDGTTTYNAYAIFEGERPVMVFPEAGTVSLPPRWAAWDWQIALDVVSERLTHYAHD